MSETEQLERTCRYPGCTRPPARPEAGTGRPPEYCDDPEHTRAAAWRERRRLDQQAGPGRPSPVPARPVDAARQRASEIRGQVAGMIEHLEVQLAELAEQLRTAGDPDAAEVQLETVATEAAEQVAAANVRASRAEVAQRKAESERSEADDAALEATAAAERLEGDLEDLRGQLGEVTAARERLGVDLEAGRDAAALEREEALAAITAVGQEFAAVRTHLVDVEQERDTLSLRLQESGQARNQALAQARAAESRADRAEAATAAVTGERDEARREAGQLREQVAEVRGGLVAVTAERETARAEIAHERERGDQRLTDAQESHRRQLAERQGEVDELRAEVREQRTRADRAEGQLAVRQGGAGETPTDKPAASKRRRRPEPPTGS
jgi:colicin import membrane protein